MWSENPIESESEVFSSKHGLYSPSNLNKPRVPSSKSARWHDISSPWFEQQVCVWFWLQCRCHRHHWHRQFNSWCDIRNHDELLQLVVCEPLLQLYDCGPGQDLPRRANNRVACVLLVQHHTANGGRQKMCNCLYSLLQEQAASSLCFLNITRLGGNQMLCMLCRSRDTGDRLHVSTNSRVLYSKRPWRPFEVDYAGASRGTRRLLAVLSTAETSQSGVTADQQNYCQLAYSELQQPLPTAAAAFPCPHARICNRVLALPSSMQSR
jgi:hypothetical protein